MTAEHLVTRTLLTLGGTLIAGGIVLLPASATFAAPSPSPSRDGDTISTAGTSFLTATTVDLGQPVKLAGSTGDYLYWSFEAKAGQTPEVAATVTLPAAGSRHGAQTWTVEVFDGLRRRQACTAGTQTPTAQASDPSVALGCALRQVRSWAEPWSGDPLPGLYYIRLSATDLPEQDLGLTTQVSLKVTAADDDDPSPEGGDLKEPLVPAGKPGKVVANPSPSASASTESDWLPDIHNPLPEASTRWLWTVTGGVLAAIAGVLGFRFTRRPRGGPVR